MVEQYGKSLGALHLLIFNRLFNNCIFSFSEYLNIPKSFSPSFLYGLASEGSALIPHAGNRFKSVYKRKKHGSEEWEYFHLHPELVELNDEADDERRV